MVIECYEIAPGGKYISAKKAVEYGISIHQTQALKIREFVDLARSYFIGEDTSYAIIMLDGSFRYETDVDEKVEFVFIQNCLAKNITAYKIEGFTGLSDQ